MRVFVLKKFDNGPGSPDEMLEEQRLIDRLHFLGHSALTMTLPPESRPSRYPLTEEQMECARLHALGITVCSLSEAHRYIIAGEIEGDEVAEMLMAWAKRAGIQPLSANDLLVKSVV